MTFNAFRIYRDFQTQDFKVRPFQTYPQFIRMNSL